MVVHRENIGFYHAYAFFAHAKLKNAPKRDLSTILKTHFSIKMTRKKFSFFCRPDPRGSKICWYQGGYVHMERLDSEMNRFYSNKIVQSTDGLEKTGE